MVDLIFWTMFIRKIVAIFYSVNYRQQIPQYQQIRWKQFYYEITYTA